MKVFDYIYYRVCDYYKKKRDSTAESTGSLIISLIQSLIILDFAIIIRIFWEYKIPEKFNKFWLLPIIIIFIFYNFNKYQKPRKYRDFRTIWKDENQEKREIRGIGIVILIVVEFLIPILYGFLKHNIIEGRSFLG